MSRVKVPLTLIAVVVSTIMFIVSWNVFGSGIATTLLPDTAKTFIEPANNAINDWNTFASENGIGVVVTTPIVLDETTSDIPPNEAPVANIEEEGVNGVEEPVG